MKTEKSQTAGVIEAIQNSRFWMKSIKERKIKPIKKEIKGTRFCLSADQMCSLYPLNIVGFVWDFW